MARPRAYKLKGLSGEFKNATIYYTGFAERPSILPESGRGFGGLKAILELLKARFKRFTLTITPREDSARKVGKTYKIRLSLRAARRLSQRRWDANTQLNRRLAKQLLAEAFPDHFDPTMLHTYQRGMFAEILSEKFDTRLLAAEDRVAITKLISSNLANAGGALDVSTAYKATRDVQLLYLARLVDEFDREVSTGHDENWWQTYFSKNILFFQDSYIQRIEKLNVIVAGTQFPDFLVVTSDGYLDILEIKKPGTELLKEDRSRHNHYWSTEISKAVSQVENYIDRVTKYSDAIRNKLRDDHNIELRIIKPRGIVIAGKAAEFVGKVKKADDFRLLNEGLKNVEIVPYDELSRRLKNTIVSIEKLAKSKEGRKSGRRKND